MQEIIQWHFSLENYSSFASWIKTNCAVFHPHTEVLMNIVRSVLWVNRPFSSSFNRTWTNSCDIVLKIKATLPKLPNYIFCETCCDIFSCCLLPITNGLYFFHFSKWVLTLWLGTLHIMVFILLCSVLNRLRLDKTGRKYCQD